MSEMKGFGKQKQDTLQAGRSGIFFCKNNVTQTSNHTWYLIRKIVFCLVTLLITFFKIMYALITIKNQKCLNVGIFYLFVNSLKKSNQLSHLTEKLSFKGDIKLDYISTNRVMWTLCLLLEPIPNGCSLLPTLKMHLNICENYKLMCVFIADTMHVATQRSRADAYFYQMKLQAEANSLLLTPQYLELKRHEAIANNTKIFFGPEIPKVFWPHSQVPGV